ncbi:hypothetical protein ABZ446_01825 [Streptomyces sp. NPDC005813]|uniref:hypothetical protein n=1 Tax=Streptomyces sp. NPDC005813 TaxID=3155592 RepID=UPI0033D7EA22
MTQRNLSAPEGALITAPEPSDLAVAIRVAQQMLDVYGDSSKFADIFAYAQAHGALTESLRILLRAHGIETAGAQ